MKSNKVGLGIIGEKFSDSVAKSIFKVKDGYRVKHVDWDNYSYGHGLDLRVFKRNKQVLAVEVKNWREMNRPYGTETARTEIIDRFKNYAGGLKVLIISFLCLLTKKALELLEAHNIHIVEVGKLIGKNDFPPKGHNAKAFYSLKAKIERLFKERAKSVFCGVHSGCGNQLLLSGVDTTTVNNNQLKQHKEHDTQPYKQANNSPNPLAVYLLNQLKGKTRFKEKT